MIGEGPRVVEPLRIVAHLAEGIVLRHPLHLDAILASVVAGRVRALPPMPGDRQGVEIPIQREIAGRFHMVSDGICVKEHNEVRYKNGRAPWVEYSRLGNSKIKNVKISMGQDKSVRRPYSISLMLGDAITWWCLGDAEMIRDLLHDVRYIGKFSTSGKGRVVRWEVSPCSSWHASWNGFPVLADSKPMRALPLDWPGVAAGVSQVMAPLSYPYWDKTASEFVYGASL
jgi:hypothetical protein